LPHCLPVVLPFVPSKEQERRGEAERSSRWSQVSFATQTTSDHTNSLITYLFHS
jgi:hypothetical protein